MGHPSSIRVEFSRVLSIRSQSFVEAEATRQSRFILDYPVVQKNGAYGRLESGVCNCRALNIYRVRQRLKSTFANVNISEHPKFVITVLNFQARLPGSLDLYQTTQLSSINGAYGRLEFTVRNCRALNMYRARQRLSLPYVNVNVRLYLISRPYGRLESTVLIAVL